MNKSQRATTIVLDIAMFALKIGICIFIQIINFDMRGIVTEPPNTSPVPEGVCLRHGFTSVTRGFSRVGGSEAAKRVGWVVAWTCGIYGR